MALFGTSGAVATEQLAIVSPGPAPDQDLVARDLEKLGRHSWTALPSSSLLTVTSLRAAETEPVDAWRLNLGETARFADTRTGRRDLRPPQSVIPVRKLGGFDLDFTGDYSRVPRPMRGAARMVDHSKLLRWSAVLRRGGLRLSGTFGNHPIRLAEELSWSALARYDRGPFSLGLVYNYTLEPQSSGRAREDAYGSLQGGISYAITTRITASVNAAYWDSLSSDGDAENDLGGLVGLSWRF